MPKALSKKDFRAIRVVLKRSDFAVRPATDPSPSDLIDKKTWREMTCLTDDVSIRSTDYQGSLFRLMSDIRRTWIKKIEFEENPTYDAMTDAYDEFQASIFNTLCGYYRTAVGCLRSALEQITMGTYYQICGTSREYHAWRSGKAKSRFGFACARLEEASQAEDLSHHLQKTIGYSLFDQNEGANQGVWTLRLHAELSEYLHSRPGFSHADQWESNGPVYSAEALDFCFEKYLETTALGFILVKLSLPELKLPKTILKIFKSAKPGPLSIVKVAFEFLF